MSDASNARILQTAGFLRRLVAVGVDALTPLLFVVGLLLIGALPGDLLNVPPQWFLSEWWLHNWLNSPRWFIWPFALFAMVFVCWSAAWEQALGRTPGAMLMGIEIVDSHGHMPGRARLLGRSAASLVNIFSLGLGFLWIIASRYRLGWHDLLSGTRHVVNRGRGSRREKSA